MRLLANIPLARKIVIRQADSSSSKKFSNGLNQFSDSASVVSVLHSKDSFWSTSGPKRTADQLRKSNRSREPFARLSGTEAARTVRNAEDFEAHPGQDAARWTTESGMELP